MVEGRIRQLREEAVSTCLRAGRLKILSVVAVLMGVYNDVNAFLSDFGSDTLFIFKFDPGIHTSGRLTPEERNRGPSQWCSYG